MYRRWETPKLGRDGKTTLPTWDNVEAWRWLLCKWSSILAINGAAAVMNPNLIPLLTTLEKESNLITLPSVSRDKNDFGSTYVHPNNGSQNAIKNWSARNDQLSTLLFQPVERGITFGMINLETKWYFG